VPAEFVTGWKYPTAFGVLFSDWANPQNVRFLDGVYSVAISQDPVYTKWHGFTGFDFTASDLPSGSLIRGFRVKHAAKKSALVSTTRSGFVLVKNGVAYGDQLTPPLLWTSTSVRTQYTGGDGQMGGEAALWLDTDIVGVANFGVVAYAEFSVDWATLSSDLIELQVYYDAPPAISEEPHQVEAAQGITTNISLHQSIGTDAQATQFIRPVLSGSQALAVLAEAAQRFRVELDGKQDY
jgi:hypothetical protein